MMTIYVCKYFTDTYQTAVSFAIHEPDNKKKKRAKLEEIEKHNLPSDDDDLRMQMQNNHVHLVIPYCKISALTESDLTAKRKKKAIADTFKLGNQVKDFNPIKYGSEIKKDTPDLMNTQQNFLQFMRAEWCRFINNSLELNNRIERYTHKSYKDLGLSISATVHEGEARKNILASGQKTAVNEYNKRQKAKQQTEADYLNFINVPLPAELAHKILSGQKLAEKELLNSLKSSSNKVEDLKPSQPNLREKLDRLKESTNSPGPKSLQQKLERLKQKQVEQPTSIAEPKHDNDNDYSPF